MTALESMEKKKSGILKSLESFEFDEVLEISEVKGIQKFTLMAGKK